MADRTVRVAFAALFTLIGLLPAPVSAQQVTNYIVGPQDVLMVALYDQPELGGKYTVEADGTFTFPMIGRVTAGGRTLREIEAEVRRLLADGFFRNPQVSVAVEHYRSQTINIVGEVRNPGNYPLAGDMTLIDALARAGHTVEGASGEALILRRRSGKQIESPLPVNPTEVTADADTEIIRVDIRELQTGRLSQNVALRGNDTIWVPSAELIYIDGQVKNPGSYPLRRDMTVRQALSLAGGINDRGSDRRIRIERVVNGERTVLRDVKLEDPIRANDTIIVQERFF